MKKLISFTLVLASVEAIDRLMGEGYRLVTVETLFKLRGGHARTGQGLPLAAACDIEK